MPGSRTITMAFALLSAHWTIGQAPRPCTAEVQGSATAQRLCRESLPAGGYITLGDGAGGFCACRCEELFSLAYGEVLMRREVLDSVNTSHFLHYLATAEPSDVCADRPPARGIVYESGSFEWFASDTCSFDLVVVEVIREILGSGIIDFAEGEASAGGFAFVLEQDDRDVMFPYICPVMNDGELGGRIHIPRRFLRDASVKVELVRFMLLHELAHPTLTNESEFAADEKASFVWLSRFVGDAAVVAERARIVKQLWDYSISQFLADDFDQATCTDPVNCYPELNCRLQGILSGFAGELGPFIHGYPTDCWGDRVGIAGVRANPNYDHRWCKPFVRSCSRLPGVCELESQLELILYDLPLIYDPCESRPELCEPRAEGIEPVLRNPVNRIEPRQHKLQRAISLAERRAADLRTDILKAE